MSHGAVRESEHSISTDVAVAEWDLRTIWRLLTPHRTAIIVGLLIGLICGIAYGLLSPAQYESTVEVAPPSSPSNGSQLGGIFGQLGSIASLAGIEIPGSTEDRTAIVVLRSHSFIREFLRQENALETVQEDSIGILSRLFGWRLQEQELIDHFRGRLMRVEEDRLSGSTRLTIRSQDRDAAARWANGMIRQLNVSQQQRAIDELKRSISYLEQQINGATSVEVQQALYAAMEGQLKAMALASAREDYAFRVLDPAIPALENDPVVPNTPLLALFGALVGAATALLTSLLFPRRHGA